ncbi:MAG: cytochrome biosis protein [Phycisphaerales bacterium]|nr:cytochrome biosis protein [Phycisphaerales bacterium]
MFGLFDKDSDGFTKLAGLALLALVAFAGWRHLHPKTAFAADGADPVWDNKVARSKSEGKPGLVLFTADWCGACRALHEQVLSQPEVVAAMAERYTVTVVDLTDPNSPNGGRAQQMGVSGIPTLIRYDVDGTESARTHFLPPAAMVKWLRVGE